MKGYISNYEDGPVTTGSIGAGAPLTAALGTALLSLALPGIATPGIFCLAALYSCQKAFLVASFTSCSFISFNLSIARSSAVNLLLRYLSLAAACCLCLRR